MPEAVIKIKTLVSYIKKAVFSFESYNNLILQQKQDSLFLPFDIKSIFANQTHVDAD